jgi:hypothetical protein
VAHLRLWSKHWSGQGFDACDAGSFQLESARQIMRSQPDYGIDAPHVIRNLLLSGLGAIILCLLLPSFRIGKAQVFLFPNFIWMGAWLILTAVLMILYSKFGKFRHRDRILNLVQWTGKEQVLDVGTGRGLLLAGAKKNLQPGGRSESISGTRKIFLETTCKTCCVISIWKVCGKKLR